MRLVIPSSPRKPLPKKRHTKTYKKPYVLILFGCAMLGTLLFSSHGARAACNFLLKFNGADSTSGPFLTPRGVALDSSGNVYVVDANTRIAKFTSAGVIRVKGAVESFDGEIVVVSSSLGAADDFARSLAAK